ncbi:TraR/DksA family transcriptional regulator [Patescibacteria group bacterium]
MKKKKKTSKVVFPKRVLLPVSNFLKANLKKLESRKKKLSKDDPFANSARVSDNASPDTDAAEQEGHERSSAVRGQIDRKIIQTKKALSRIKVGKYGTCEVCGDMIDTDRLMIYPETTHCTKHASKK